LFLAGEFRLGAGEEAADVGVVADEDEDCNRDREVEDGQMLAQVAAMLDAVRDQ